MDKDNKNLINSSVQEMEALLESSFYPLFGVINSFCA